MNRQTEIASLDLSKVLDKLGYSAEMRSYRMHAYREYDRLMSQGNRLKKVTAGSKGEGITKSYESDIDVLFFIPRTVCFEEGFPVNRGNIPQETTAFTMPTRLSYPGYSRLPLLRQGTLCLSIIHDSIEETFPGRHFLSSDTFSELVNTGAKQVSHIAGMEPKDGKGVAASSSLGLFKSDNVLTIPCIVPSILNRWLIRERLYDWPPVELRHKISTMEGNVVPSGFKGGEWEHIEWRICFNEIELLLTHSLNETQIKLYILLKLVMKTILKPKEKEITSYVMKNIVWWLAENNPTDQFKEHRLLHWMMKALLLLKKSLNMNYLPYYMIPERDLFIENMTEPLRARLLFRLGRILPEGPVFLRRNKLLFGLRFLTYKELCEFSSKRDELEMLVLTVRINDASLLAQGLSKEEIINNPTRRAIERRQYEIVNSQWPFFLQKQLCEIDDWEDRLQLILH